MLVCLLAFSANFLIDACTEPLTASPSFLQAVKLSSIHNLSTEIHFHIIIHLHVDRTTIILVSPPLGGLP